MNTIKKDELYRSVNGFLKSKGVSLSGGTYSKAVRKACDFLTDAVNLANEGVKKTRVKVDANLDKLRQTIHEATAPSPADPPVKKKATRKKAAKKSAAKKTASKPAVKKKSVARKRTTRPKAAPKKPRKRAGSK